MMSEAMPTTHAGGWFDSHCHLQDAYVAERGGEVDLTLQRAFSSGVERAICVGTDEVTSRQALALVRSFRDRPGGVPQLWATIGLHPHEASRGTAGVRELVDEELGRATETGSRVLVGIGECGLDYHYDHSARAEQRAAFADQIAFAHAHGLTLVVHSREAWDDMFSIFGTEGVPRRTVLHCFTGGPSELERCLALGTFVSFSGIVTFKNALEVQAAAQQCPIDRLLVETDTPFLAPVPYRGKANEPGFVPYVGAAIAALRGVAPGAIAVSSAAAAARAFGLDPSPEATERAQI
jgi:TatD DNase family protein